MSRLPQQERTPIQLLWKMKMQSISSSQAVMNTSESASAIVGSEVRWSGIFENGADAWSTTRINLIHLSKPTLYIFFDKNKTCSAERSQDTAMKYHEGGTS